MSARVPAMLRSMLPPGLVTFDLNPDHVVMTRQAQVGSRASASSNAGSPAGASGSIFRRATAAQINLTKVVFYGSDTKMRCDQLLDWMTPGGGLLGAIAGAALSALTGGAINLASKLPLVTRSKRSTCDDAMTRGIRTGCRPVLPMSRSSMACCAPLKRCTSLTQRIGPRSSPAVSA